jgi:2,3-bisphosphoglycerate-independent phosphoglycerate mutase
MSVLLVFIDGIGFGQEGAPNPFDGSPSKIFAPLSGREGATSRDDVVVSSIDATLGHAGLPQSATGQATLYTGTDAIAVAGGHRSAWPTGALIDHVKRESLFAKARKRGISAGFLNAYDGARAQRYARIFRGEEARPKRFHMSASTIAALAGGETPGDARALATEKELLAGRAATFDLTGDVIRAHGYPSPLRSIAEAARAVAAGAREKNLALFETFLTDEAGHAQDMTWARHEIARLDLFLATLFDVLDARNDLVVVTSDHGNLEDLSTRSHTRNRIPLFAWGNGATELTRAVVAGGASLASVADVLLHHAKPR